MIKRFFDLVLSILLIFILSPIFVFIIFLIKVVDKNKAFFLQERVGMNGKIFKIIKFKTMRNVSSGTKITIGRDSRITKLGLYLRRWKLDEIPQLFNVFKGEMSFVGPRPEVKEYVRLYEEEFKEILTVRPGITGLASLKYRNESEILEKSDDPLKFYTKIILPNKILLEKEYIKKKNVIYDLFLIILTLFKVVGINRKLKL